MAAFTKFTCFATDLGLKLHQLNTDTIRVHLTNHLPVAGADTVYSPAGTGNTNGPDDLATGGGYTEDGEDTANTYSAGNCAGTDVTFTATTGFGPFQWAVIYNDTAAAKNLIGWWEYPAPVTLLALETFKVDFGATMFTVT